MSHIPGEKIRFIQLGTIDKRKGFDVILEAYKNLDLEYRSKIDVFLAGQKIDSSIDYYNDVLAECKKLGVTYLGEITGIDERIRLCSRMDVFIVASRDEACSLTALESIMLSKPLIVSENVGAKYVVTAENGIIVRTGSVEEMSRALIYFVDNKSKLIDMGKSSREIYDKTSTMGVYSENILDMVNKLLEMRTLTPYNIYKRVERKIKIRRETFVSRDNIFKKVSYCFERRVNGFSKNDEIIVSLTSYPPRINTVAVTVNSIINQTLKPDHIELWLSDDEFPNKEKDLPNSLLDLQKKGLEIFWCDNLGPHKKYFYSLQKHPESIVITVDDDVRYSHNLVAKLYQSYLRYPYCVSCMRAHRIIFTSRGGLKPYSKWVKTDDSLVGEPSFQAIATGVGGVLYPPKFFNAEFMNVDLIKKNCLNADDIWLKFIGVVNNTPTVLVEKIMPLQELNGTQRCGLFHENVLGKRNDLCIEKSLLAFSQAGYNIIAGLKKEISECPDWVSPLKLRNKLAIMCPAGKKLTKHNGDYHFCSAIKKYFERKGYDVELRCVEDWYAPFDGRYVLTLRGSREYYPKKQYFNIMWNISHPERVSTLEYNKYNLVFIASYNWCNVVKSKCSVPVFPLLQCTDPDLFNDDVKTNLTFELLFVGYAHEEGRKIIEDLLPTDFDLSVYGPRWEGKIPDVYIKGEMIPNDVLGSYYRNSKIVLNDHLRTMREKGFVSNRIYDVSAAGGFVISDNVSEISDIFGDLAITYTSRDDLNGKIQFYLSHSAERESIVAAMRKIVLENHTFMHRVNEIIEKINQFDAGISAIDDKI